MGDSRVAQGAVEMEVQFDFGELRHLEKYRAPGAAQTPPY